MPYTWANPPILDGRKGLFLGLAPTEPVRTEVLVGVHGITLQQGAPLPVTELHFIPLRCNWSIAQAWEDAKNEHPREGCFSLKGAIREWQAWILAFC